MHTIDTLYSDLLSVNMIKTWFSGRLQRSRVVASFSRREITLAFASLPLQKRHHHHHDTTSKPSIEPESLEGSGSSDKAMLKVERAKLEQEQRQRSQAWQRELVETASGLE